MDNAQTWYYLLSTISQTCGAILALSAAFVVFKLAEISEGIRNYRGRVVTILELKHPEGKKPMDMFQMTPENVLKEYDKHHLAMESLMNFEFAIDLNNQYPNDVILIDISGSQSNRNRSANLAKEWCEKMVALFRNNLEAKAYIYRQLFWSLVLLTISIVCSITLLTLGKFIPHLLDNSFWLSVSSLIAIISIIFSAHADWRIANKISST